MIGTEEKRIFAKEATSEFWAGFHAWKNTNYPPVEIIGGGKIEMKNYCDVTSGIKKDYQPVPNAFVSVKNEG